MENAKKRIRILAVETSCDETAAAVVSRELNSPYVNIETSVVASQAKLHEKYGGVYPEVASREHVKQILPVIAEALGIQPTESGLSEFILKDIDYLAVTQGPGLIGSLLVGTQAVATLAYASGIPIIPVNHLAGHIYASFISNGQERFIGDADSVPQFPLMALIVSGGHTMLLYMPAHHTYQLLGQTRDDAAGEAFDKVAKLLGLGYPGGPLISKLATQGDRHTYNFPLGLAQEDTYDFSFSGLKTAVLREVQKIDSITETDKQNIAASFERAVVEALLLKITHALKKYPVRHFVLGGGVAANSYLRDRLGAFLAHRLPAITFHVPEIHLCTDNAAVIGAAACFATENVTDPKLVDARARLPLV